MTRAEKVAQAQVLRGQGLKLREIAERMESKTKTVHGWLADPDLSKQKARRARYSQPCVDCGAPTDGSGGYADPCERCTACAHQYEHDTRQWTPERNIEAFHAFHVRYGRPPTATEAVQNRSPDVPPAGVVIREFGRWSDGIRAAGFEPYKELPTREESAERRAEIVRLYVAEKLGATTIAELVNLNVSSIDWHLARAGVKRRSRSEAQQLRLARERLAA